MSLDPSKKEITFLTTKEAAAFLGLAPRTLMNWRNLGKGPAYTRMGEPGSPVRYSSADLLDFMNGCTRVSPA